MKRNVIISTLMIMLLVSGCGASQSRKMEYIGADAAKNLALEASGLAAEQVDFSGTDMASKNGMDYYEVNFTSEGQEYQYAIDALTGKIIDSRKGSESTAGETVQKEAEDRTRVSAVNTEQGSGKKTIEIQKTADKGKDIISVESAKEAALAHAGLTEEQVTFVKTGLDWDDGKQTYDLEFYTSDYREYDYDIDPYSGEVLSFDHDAEYYAPKASDTAGNTITAEEAREKVLAQVPGATPDDIREFEADYDDGRLEYEGKIYYEHMEYEFEIDGYSGAIRTWEVESIYD